MVGKTKSPDDQIRLAVLIDADNAQPSVIEGLLAEVAIYGVASVKRIYGDWTSPNLKQWKESLNRHSLNPMQQFAYTQGKNAMDSSLIIDAMDLMYTRRFDGFCLVTSDSDFTRLAQRLREEGLMVYGFGERKTPDPFVRACDKFIYTEVLRPGYALEKPSSTVNDAASPLEQSVATTPPATIERKPSPPVVTEVNKSSKASTKEDATKSGTTKSDNGFPMGLVHQAVEESSDDAGWSFLGAVGSYLTKVRPDFDSRLYGQKKLSDLLRQYPKHFTLEERGASGAPKAVYVRATKR